MIDLNKEKTHIYSLPIINDNSLNLNICEFEDQVEIFISKPNICLVRFTIYNNIKTTGIISNLFVHNDYRRDRYGRILMDSCIDIAKVMNLKVLSLFVEKDTFVHKWYNKLGFVDYMISASDDKFIELINIL